MPAERAERIRLWRELDHPQRPAFPGRPSQLGAAARQGRHAHTARREVALAHAGGGCASFTDPEDLSSCRQQGEIFQLARALPPGLVDVIAGGHAHFGIAHRVNGIALVEAYELGRAFSRVDLRIDEAGRATDVRIHPPRPLCDGATVRDVGSWAPDACAPPPYEGRPVRHDARMVAVLRKDIAAAQRKREQPLGVEAARAYPHSTRDESPASHFVVDLLRASHPGSDVAIYNATGTRAGLPRGPITYGHIYALLPFDSVPPPPRHSPRPRLPPR